MGNDELVADIRDALVAVGLEARSAVIYGSIASGTEDEDSDIDLLIIYDVAPEDTVLGDLEDLLDYQITRQVNPTFVHLEEAVARSIDPGDPISWAAAGGLQVMGEPIAELLPAAAPHDSSEAARRAHRAALARAEDLGSRDLSQAPGAAVADVLTTAARATLLNHGLGRYKTVGARLEKGTERLGGLIGVDSANQVAHLIKQLEHDLDRPPHEVLASAESLLRVLLEAASDPEAPGPTTLS